MPAIHGIEILIDDQKDNCTDSSARVSLILDAVSLHWALRLAQRQLDLTYVVAEAVMLMATSATAKQMVQVRVYDVGDRLIVRGT